MRVLVLRTVPYRDHDLIVDLLSGAAGRFSVMARGARRSRKRFGGALEVGTRLDVETSRGRGQLATLSAADVVGPLRAIRTDLDRFYQLSYVLEVARLTIREGEGDARLYGVVVSYIEALEAASATAEGLAVWDLGMLAAHGYALRLGRCVVTGGPPDGLSLRAGGAVLCAMARVPDAVRVPAHALAALTVIADGRTDARLDAAGHAGLRRAFASIWEGVAGKPLRTPRFLLDLPA